MRRGDFTATPHAGVAGSVLRRRRVRGVPRRRSAATPWVDGEAPAARTGESMEIIKTTARQVARSLGRATRVLANGGVIVYPTDTAYGLGVRLDRSAALKKIVSIKGRSARKPLPVIADSVATVRNFFSLNSTEQGLIRRYWPGPLTLLLKTKRTLPGAVVRASRVAVRVPAAAIARLLATRAGGLLISTSANRAGKPACYTAADVLRQFRRQRTQPNLILDAGRLPHQSVSTIVRVRGERVEVVRRGAVRMSSCKL